MIMFSKEYANFRDHYQCETRFDPYISHAFFHTASISKLNNICNEGLLSYEASGSSEIGWGLGPSFVKHFTRMFHVDRTPFLYNRYKKIGGRKIALLIISSKILDDRSVSIIGMSSHGLAYWKEEYCNAYFLKTKNNSKTNKIQALIKKEMPTSIFWECRRDKKIFFSKMIEDFDLPAKSKYYNWTRGEVLFCSREAFPGYGAGEWGNIRHAEILIYPKVPAKYILGIACTVENKQQIESVFPQLKIYNLDEQGIKTDD